MPYKNQIKLIAALIVVSFSGMVLAISTVVIGLYVYIETLEMNVLSLQDLISLGAR